MLFDLVEIRSEELDSDEEADEAKGDRDKDVSGSGDELMVNDANVICGGVHTANATVYLIDSVLMPPA